MDPNIEITLGLAALDAVVKLVGQLAAQKGLTPEQLLAHADSLDLENKDKIKALLAL